jgi:salicylate hydroxylase
MTRILEDWGMHDFVEKNCLRSSGMSFLVAKTGDKVGELNLTGGTMKDFRPFVFVQVCQFIFSLDSSSQIHSSVQHCDLCDSLLRLATGAGAIVRHNATVISVDASEGSVTLSSGEKLVGDIVVGADGSESLVRDALLDGSLPSTPSPHAGVR